MGQRDNTTLKTYTVLAEDLCLIPNTYIRAFATT